MKKLILRTLGVLFLIGYSNTIFAANIKISWSANNEPDLGGYKIFYGEELNNYTETIDVGNVTKYTIKNLSAGIYYITASAYDLQGNESDLSYAIVKKIKVGVVKNFKID